MDHEAAGIGLDRVLRDLPGVAQAIGEGRPVRRLRHRVEEALHAGDRLGRALEPLLGEQRRPQAVARGIADADALGRPAQAFAQARRLRGRVAERPDHAPLVEPDQLAGGGGGAEHAAARGDVPALGVVAGRDGAADPALQLDAEQEGEQQVGPGHAPQLCQRQQRRRHRRGRMDHGRQVGVAEIEHVGAGRIQEGRAQRIDALSAADDGRLSAVGEFGERLQRQLDRAGAAARQRDREEIQQRALGFMPDRLRHVVPTGVDHEAGEVLRDAGSMQHGNRSSFYEADVANARACQPDDRRRGASRRGLTCRL